MPTEKFTISGDQLVVKVKQLIREGNIRRVRVIHHRKTVLRIPLGICGPRAAVVFFRLPFLAALVCFAALVTERTLEVEKVDK